MDWVPVESSVLAAPRYSRRERSLYLKFRSGAVYRYFDFPQDIQSFWWRIPKASTLTARFAIASSASKWGGAVGWQADPISRRSIPCFTAFQRRLSSGAAVAALTVG
jgi:hypothetical protein